MTSMFMRVNSKCAHQVRPPEGLDCWLGIRMWLRAAPMVGRNYPSEGVHRLGSTSGGAVCGYPGEIEQSLTTANRGI